MKQTLIPKSYYESEIEEPNLNILYGLKEYATFCLDGDEVAIATTTFYPSKDGIMAKDVRLRAGLALKMLKAAKCPVVVVDGGSDAGWRREAASYGAKLVDEIRGKNHTMGKGRRQALAEAGNLNKEIVCWIEPEKYPFLQTSFTYCAWQVYDHDADILVPRRQDELKSYPLQQRLEELTGNLTVMELLRGYLIKNGLSVDESEKRVPYLDQWIGPRIMNRKGLEYFLNYNGKIGDAVHDRWESIFVPLWQAMLDGKLKVRGTAVDYVHPKEQTELESSSPEYSLKRIQQLNAIVDAANKFVGQFRAAK